MENCQRERLHASRASIIKVVTSYVAVQFGIKPQLANMKLPVCSGISSSSLSTLDSLLPGHRSNAATDAPDVIATRRAIDPDFDAPDFDDKSLARALKASL